MFAGNRTKRHFPESPFFEFLLVGFVAGAVIWAVSSEGRLPAFFSIVGLVLAGFYFLGNFEKVYIPFTIVVILPLVVFLTAIHELQAFEVLVPVFFTLLITRTAVSSSRGPGIRILPFAVIVFFALGLASYLRHPTLPTQVLGRVVAWGNFRNYWRFFLGLMIYVLVFHFFRSEHNQKMPVLVKLLFWLFISGIILHLGMSFLQVETRSRAGFILADWGISPPGQETTEIIFQSWSLGWQSLFLFLILISFPTIPENKYLKGALLLICLICIVLSGARSILLAAAGSAIFLCWLKKQYLLVVIPTAVVLLILMVSYAHPEIIYSLPPPARRVFTIFPSPEEYVHQEAVASAQVRVAWWQEATEIISRRPFFGIGFEEIGLDPLYLRYADYAVRVGAAHNAYIATGVMMGFPGMVLLVWIFVLHLNRGVILAKNSREDFTKNLNVWLTLVLISFNIMYLFAGSPQHLYRYLFYAGLINLNWYLETKERPAPAWSC